MLKIFIRHRDFGAGALERLRAGANLRDHSASKAADGNTDSRSLGTLVINVWHEADHPQPLRARLSSGSEDESEATVAYAASQEAILAEVSEWLQRLAEVQS